MLVRLGLCIFCGLSVVGRFVSFGMAPVCVGANVSVFFVVCVASWLVMLGDGEVAAGFCLSRLSWSVLGPSGFWWLGFGIGQSGLGSSR